MGCPCVLFRSSDVRRWQTPLPMDARSRSLSRTAKLPPKLPDRGNGSRGKANRGIYVKEGSGFIPISGQCRKTARAGGRGADTEEGEGRACDTLNHQRLPHQTGGGTTV